MSVRPPAPAPAVSQAQPPAREPLALFRGRVRAGADGVRALRFEYTSRGDRVPGRLLLPTGAGPFPLVLLQHGAGGSKDADYLDAARLPWVRRGAAVASIDFPLHGERASSKLTETLLASLGAPGAGGVEATPNLLQAEFVRQAVADLGRALDALEPLPEIEAARIAYAGFSLGAILGALFCPGEPRLRAAALALGGGGFFAGAALDPTRSLAGFAPRPVLLVNALRDERIPRSAAEALHAAAGDPKEVLWFDCGHRDLPGLALKAMWTFLARELA
jgi:dienelactone hydrolase